MANVLRLLHLALLLIMGSKVICQDGGEDELLQHNSKDYYSYGLQATGVDYLHKEASSTEMPVWYKVPSSMLAFTIRSLTAWPCLDTYFSGKESRSSLQREHIDQQSLVKPCTKNSHGHFVARSLLTESREHYHDLRLSPPVFPPAPPYKMSSPPPLPPKSISHTSPIAKPPEQAPTSQQPAPPLAPKVRKHHHRHHHFAYPPFSSRHRAAKSPPPMTQGSLPPSSQPRNSPPQVLPQRSPPPKGRPTLPPSGGRFAPPPLTPQRSPSQPALITPMPSSIPPPSEDCGEIVCLPPLTKTPFLSPCGCVRPMQIQIQLTVPLYTLFPIISVLAANIADGTVLAPSQVEITGANADSQDPDFSIVVVNLVPLDQEFDNLTALLIFQKFWDHEVPLNASLFGNYSVAYVHYPGLPASPPSQTDTGTLNGTNGNSGEDPFGVDVNEKRHKLGIVIITVIALSSAIALVACLGALWLIFLRYSRSEAASPPTEPGLMSARTKRSGGRSLLSSDIGSSMSGSFSSSMATYPSSARTFTYAEMHKATGKFRPENVIGEGGFGRVYSGLLDDGTKVAVKVLTRDQGGKEFIAEVEMLSRLHHRNVVKLIGICTEEHTRCLVYELIPNGSVESHLHGVDKELSPLDWDTRMKIALGAARGLAYLHEDSNPRVIHRDFKAGNILLENDFNPKVSDFGLAKAAPDEGREHLSTRVMGTFGYVAPEYAMTGHLLVESDVYSYGVVLLELLSGRQSVDILKPPGQANLVTWARPLLMTREGLEQLVDPALGRKFPFDSLVRVAAIASMCVHPEASQRPFMGEVVQALKLVYNDTELQNGTGSSNGSQEGESLTESVSGGQIWLDSKARYVLDGTSFISVDYDSGPSHVGDGAAARRPLSASAFFPDSLKFMRLNSSSFRRHSMSGPLRPSVNRFGGHKHQGINKQGSMSEHTALSRHFGTGLNRDFLNVLS